MKSLIYELRLLFAEALLSLALSVAPPGVHGVLMGKLIRWYIDWDIGYRRGADGMYEPQNPNKSEHPRSAEEGAAP